MELRDYLRIARRRWLLVVGTIAVSVATAAIITAQTTTTYTTSASVRISAVPTDATDAYQGSLFSQQAATTYASIIPGLDFAQRAAAELDDGTTASGVFGRLQAQVVPGTAVLQLTVTADDPETTLAIGQAAVGALEEYVSNSDTARPRKASLIQATVVDRPFLPGAPTSPKWNHNLTMALFIGLVIGLAIAVARELLDSTLRKGDDVATLAESPLLAMLPHDSRAHNRPLMTDLPPDALRAEAYRVLSVNLAHVGSNEASSSVVVTSPSSDEGRSSVAVNAALALALADRPVLLVDADLRQPAVADLLGLDEDPGLSTVLAGQATLDEAMQTHVPSGLRVLTSGSVPSNPAELLQSDLTRKLLDEASARFQTVLLDSPPLLPYADAALLADRTTGAVVVVRHAKTTREQLKQAIQRLHNVHSAPLGVIFHRTPSSRASRRTVKRRTREKTTRPSTR